MRPRVRRVHPGAWWLWALGLATAAALTTDLVLLVLIAAVCRLVVVRRGDARARSAFRFYAGIALFVVVMRVLFRVVFGGGSIGPALFTLPEVPLPGWASGIRLGGPVTATELGWALVDGVRLATIILCVGAANALADPRRLLRILPRALRDIGSAVVVAVSLAPQIVDSSRRVTRALGLRRTGGRRLLRLATPVMGDAVTRSMALAIAMEVRGFGATSKRHGRLVFVAMFLGAIAVTVGMYGMLDTTAPGPIGVPLLVAGAVLASMGIHGAGRRRSITVYRAEPWRIVETLLAASGIAVAAGYVLIGIGDPAAMHPAGWPETTLPAVAVSLIGALPAWIAPDLAAVAPVRTPAEVRP